MSLLADIQAYNYGLFAELFQGLQGESIKVVFERLASGTNAPEDLTGEIRASFHNKDANGNALSPEVYREIVIHESLLSEADFAGMSSIRHTRADGTFRYHVLSGYPYSPFGENRFWRFGVESGEKVIADDLGEFAIVDDAGQQLVDDAGIEIVAGEGEDMTFFVFDDAGNFLVDDGGQQVIYG